MLLYNIKLLEVVSCSNLCFDVIFYLKNEEEIFMSFLVNATTALATQSLRILGTQTNLNFFYC